MTAMPHIGVGVGSGSSAPPTPSTSGTCDPSLLFDLGDFLMNEGTDIPTFVNIHAPIKEESEVDIDDSSSRYVHSPVGLPIPRRPHNHAGYSFTPNSFTEPTMSSSPSMWACSSQPASGIPFPATPFNTPSQGAVFTVPDLKSIFMSGSDVISEANPTLPVAIKEEVLDLDTDLETMKTMSMFPMEEDDIFQVDKADLIQGPTLAELNANDESLLSDLNFDDFLLPSQYAGSTRVKVMSASNCDPNTGTGRYRIPDLSASAFPPPSSSSTFELLKGKNSVPIVGEEELSQLGSSQMAFELDQLQTELAVPSSGTPLNASSMETVSELPNTSPALLSASLPANFGHMILPKLTRRTEEGRVKPPPPYPTSPPQKGNNSALQDLLSLRSPGRLPSPNAASGSHSPSPTAQRPSHWAGARQRTVSNTAPSPSAATAQSMPKSPSLAATNPLLLARLSSSAPAPSVLGSSSTAGENAWQRREPRTRLLSTSSLVEEVHGSTSSISTVGILSPGSFDFSHDEGFDSEEDSDHYEDFEDSDSDSGGSDDDGREPRPGSSSTGMSKKERYFWQYNVQAKGPKGHRINLTTETIDPHVLNEVQDPVFSPYCSVDGIKHSGKARRGDGNDLTPNPRKLHNIGRELDKLNRLINDMTPVSELPMAVRPKSRKEKNKLASRACRLKKKAQHEANKVKLYGLEQEHRKLMHAIAQSKHLLAAKLEALTSRNQQQQQQQEVSNRIDRMMKSVSMKIAGHSTEFVNRVLERVKAGEPSGGLDEL